MKQLAIYCGSSKGKLAIYADKARELGEYLASANIGIVYGAGSVGLMGEIADASLTANGNVHGVIPQFLMDLEVGHENLSELEVVENMHVRKSKMIELSDGFIAMPGGFGTLDEIFEVLTWSQLSLHSKPIAFYNVNGYFDLLLDFLRRSVEDEFIKEKYVEEIIVESEPSILVERMQVWRPDAMGSGKWIKK